MGGRVRVRATAVLAVAAVVLATSGASAEDKPPEKPLGTVVIIATRTEVPLAAVTSSVAVVDQESLADRQAPTVVEALREVPGVDISQGGSLGSNASVFIRGANADQSLILVDGVEVNSATLGGFNFGNITTDNVDRIEVLRGAGGTLYGSEAIGGVVNILSRPGAGPLKATVSVGGGNIGSSSQLATVSGSKDIVAYSASVGYLTTAGFRPVNDDFTNLTSSARVDVTPIRHGTLRGFWRSANSSLGLANNDIGSGYAAIADPNARERDEFYLAKAEWEHEPIERLTYRVSGAYSRTVNEFSDEPEAAVLALPYYSDAYFLSRLRIPSDIAAAEAQVNYAQGAVGMTTAGFEFKEKSGSYKSLARDPVVPATRFDHSRSNYAGYLQQQLYLFDDRLTATGGFRVDGNEDFGRQVGASWSVGYLEEWSGHPELATHVKGGYAEGFKAPTFNALYYPMFGNRNLGAETSSEYDGGIEQHLGLTWLAVEATYFARRTKHLTEYKSPADCPAAVVDAGTYLTACDLGRADVRGVEAAVSAGPVAGLSWRGSYTYLDYDVLGGNKLLRRPHNRAATTLNYRQAELVQAADQFNANAQAVFVGERHDIDPLTYAQVDDQSMYVRVDLAVSYDMPMPGYDRIGWYARIQNLLDRQYEEVRGFRSPPINVLAGVKLTF